MKRVLRKEQGFTLVELMMVVSITLLLTSIAIYNLRATFPSTA